jgi:hypothetical protein
LDHPLHTGHESTRSAELELLDRRDRCLATPAVELRVVNDDSDCVRRGEQGQRIVVGELLDEVHETVPDPRGRCLVDGRGVDDDHRVCCRAGLPWDVHAARCRE